MMKKLYILFLILLIPFISSFNFGQSTTTTINSTSIFLNGSEVLHNDLSDLQGGAANQYYHLTLAWYNDISADIGNWITGSEADTKIADANTSIAYYANTTVNNSMKSYVDLLNASGLIRNWNESGYIINWSLASAIESDPFWSGNLSNFTLVYTYALNDSNNWNANYSNFTTGWLYATNSTGADSFSPNFSNFSVGYFYALNGSTNWNNNYSNFSTKIFNWDNNYSNFTTGWLYAVNSTGIDSFAPNFSNFSIAYYYALNSSNKTNLSYIPYIGAIGNVDLGVYDLTAHNIYASYLGGTVGSLDMSVNPWVLTTNLSVNGNITPSTTLLHYLGTGASRWGWLYVQNISAEDINTFNLTATGNITANGFFLGNGSQLTDIDYTESDPFWSGNLSNFTAVYGYALNSSLWSLNYSNFSTKIFNWDNNFSNMSVGWNYAINNSKWSLNYSNFSVGWQYAINSTSSWAEAMNNTLAQWSQVMNGTVYTSTNAPIYLNDTFRNNITNFTIVYGYALNSSLWSLNYSNFSSRIYNWDNNLSNFTMVYNYALNNTLIQNQTVGNNYITNGTGGAYIRHNGTGWVIQG